MFYGGMFTPDLALTGFSDRVRDVKKLQKSVDSSPIAVMSRKTKIAYSTIAYLIHYFRPANESQSPERRGRTHRPNHRHAV